MNTLTALENKGYSITETKYDGGVNWVIGRFGKELSIAKSDTDNLFDVQIKNQIRSLYRGWDVREVIRSVVSYFEG